MLGGGGDEKKCAFLAFKRKRYYGSPEPVNLLPPKFQKPSRLARVVPRALILFSDLILCCSLSLGFKPLEELDVPSKCHNVSTCQDTSRFQDNPKCHHNLYFKMSRYLYMSSHYTFKCPPLAAMWAALSPRASCRFGLAPLSSKAWTASAYVGVGGGSVIG